MARAVLRAASVERSDRREELEWKGLGIFSDAVNGILVCAVLWDRRGCVAVHDKPTIGSNADKDQLPILPALFVIGVGDRRFAPARYLTNTAGRLKSQCLRPAKQ